MAESETNPIILGLFKLLPEPGSEFGLVERMQFISACESVFKVIYKPDPAQQAIDSHKQRGTPCL